MAFLKQTKNSSGYIYLSCVEGYRENGKLKQRTIKNFGRLDVLKANDPDPVATAEKYIDDYNKNLTSFKLSINFDLKQKREEFANKDFGWLLLEGFYKRLGIKETLEEYSQKHKFQYDINGLFKLLCYRRALYFKCKMPVDSFQKTLFGKWDFSINQINRCIRHLEDCQKLLVTSMHKTIFKGTTRAANIEFFDISDLFINTDIDLNETPLISLGIVIDENGIPITYEIFYFKENTMASIIPRLDDIKEQFQIENLSIIQSRSLTLEGFQKTTKFGYGWFQFNSTQNLDELPQNIKDFVLDEHDWKYDNLFTTALKSKILQFEREDGEIVKQKILAVWNQEEANFKDCSQMGIHEFIFGLRCPNKYKPILHESKKAYEIKMLTRLDTSEQVELNPFLDLDPKNQEPRGGSGRLKGITIIATSLIKETDRQLMNTFVQSAIIKKSIKYITDQTCSKTGTLKTDKMIKLFFLEWFVPLMLVSLLKYRLDNKYSSREIVQALQSAKARYVGQDYFVTECNETLVKILRDFRINFSSELQPIEVLGRLRRLL